MRVSFKMDGIEPQDAMLLVDGEKVPSAGAFTMMAKAGELPVAVMEQFIMDGAELDFTARRIAWIVSHVTGKAANKLEVVQDEPNKWTVTLVKSESMPTLADDPA